MKIINFIIIIFLFINISFANTLLETNEYELKFTSENLNLIKEKKINEIKIKSFKIIISRMLTNEDYKKINTNNIKFVNKFILNFTINDEKIINNNYYSKIKINFNQYSIIDYFIKNKIKYVNYTPDKFLIIIKEQNELDSHLLSKENSFYKYLFNSKNKIFNQFFHLPNLDYNDRFLFSDYHFENDIFNNNELLNKKYKTNYQILIKSNKENNFYVTSFYLYYNNKKYFISELKGNYINYEIIFNKILSKSINKWKDINNIDTSIINTLECKIKINNVKELSYVRNLLQSNTMINNFQLKLIELNKNIYNISYFGNLNIFKNSLEKNRLRLILDNDTCEIKLV
ncbi:MAG: hypothetical protein CMP16_04340 [Rickettsiales bacterium]|nr:hypothetical protein [Rickettsiales bacterium]